MTHLQRSR